eukprot:14827038-Ditylum_brightwellii.AAC.1
MYEEVTNGLGFKTHFTVLKNNDEVMSRLLLHNKLHLHQVWETPCVRGPIKEYIGEYGLGIRSKDILDEMFDPNLAENLPTLNQWLKNHIRRVAALISIRVELTLEDYKALMKSQDEAM